MEDTSIHLFDEDKSPLTLELVGTPEGKEKIRKIRVTIDRIDSDKSGNQKLVVSFPPVMDTAHAGCAVDLLLDRWDNQHTFLHTLVLTGLRFTQGGVSAMTTFLGMQNVVGSIEQVIFHDIIGGEILRQDENSVHTLCKTLHTALNLETIDLSHNALGSYAWEALGRQAKLKHLTLLDVEMDDASVQALRNQFACGDTLMSFSLSNRTRTGPAACQAMDEMLKSCRNLRSFVWENIQMPNERAQSNLPLAGLAQLSKNMFKNDFGCMRQLELIGGVVPADLSKLCNALEGFHKLQTLKLSRTQLDSEKIQRIITALRSARPPLATIDFSHNQIDCEGASWIAQLSCLRAVTKNLKMLNLEHNRIAQKGALEVVESFASKSSDFELKLDGNAFDPCQMFLSLASSKYAAETELKGTRKDCDRLKAEKKDAQNNLRELLQAQTTMVNDMHELKSKAKQLEEDKEDLVKAFGVLGMMQHVKERDSILARLAELEKAVHGKPQKNGVKNGKTAKSVASPSRLLESPEIGWARRAPPLLESPDPSMSRSAPRPKSKSFDEISPPPFHSKSPRKAPRSTSLDDIGPPPTSRIPIAIQPPASSMAGNHDSFSRSPRATGRPGTARHLLVKAASERWKSLLKNPPEKEPDDHAHHRRHPPPMRSKSSKSLAEFLNRSAPDGFRNNDDSFSLLEDDSIQTTPVPSLGGARRRIRMGQKGSSSRSLPHRNESKSLQSPALPPLDKMEASDWNDSLESMPDHTRRSTRSS